jgi:8-oxo-dGTP pyrophosphatase MutT (NUDIX family)
METTLRREVSEEIGVKNLEVVEYLGEFPGAQKPDRIPVFLCHTSEEP